MTDVITIRGGHLVVSVIMYVILMPLILFVTPIIAYIYVRVHRFAVLPMQQIRRMSSGTASPIFGLFGECLQGTTMTRAHALEDYLCRSFAQLAQVRTQA